MVKSIAVLLSLACAIGSAGCRSGSRTSSMPHAQVPPARPAPAPAPRDLHLDLTFVSGTRIAGRGEDRALALHTNEGRIGIALSEVCAIDRSDDGETVQVRTADGRVRRAVLETEAIEVLPTGVKAPRSVALAGLKALRVTPRVRIAGSGDAWWDLSFVNALGWQVENRDDRLSVRHVDPMYVNSASHGPWSTARLSRDIAPLGDFRLDATLAWDAEGAETLAMQDLYVSLLDVDGHEVACAGHHDAWTATTGSRYSRLGGKARESGYGSQPAAGRTQLRILRDDGHVRVFFDDDEVHVCECRAPVGRVVVQVDFYAYVGPGRESVFGTMTLERLEIR